MSSGDNTEISANKELDIYGKKKLIGYTDGRTEWGAKQQMHVYGGTSLITAKSRIDYKAPQIAKMPQPGIFEYTKEPSIISAKWVENDLKTKKYNISPGENASIVIHTRNYKKGEIIIVKVKEKNNKTIKDDQKELTFKGLVDENGYAILKQIFNFK